MQSSRHRCMSSHVHPHTQRIHTHTHTQTHTCIYIHTYIYGHINAHTQTYTHIHICALVTAFTEITGFFNQYYCRIDQVMCTLYICTRLDLWS